MYYYLLIIILFSIQSTVNWLLPNLVFVPSLFFSRWHWFIHFIFSNFSYCFLDSIYFGSDICDVLSSTHVFIFRQRGREGERQGEKHQCVVATHASPTEDLAYYPGMCPDWVSNWRPFGLQGGAQCIEPHQSEQILLVSWSEPVLL